MSISIDALPDGRYFDGTCEWDKEGTGWTPLRAPFGMPTRPALTGLRRVVTTYEPLEPVDEAPTLTIVAWGATPEQADAIFTGAMDAAYEVAPDGLAVDGIATLAPGATWSSKNGDEDA